MYLYLQSYLWLDLYLYGACRIGLGQVGAAAEEVDVLFHTFTLLYNTLWCVIIRNITTIIILSFCICEFVNLYLWQLLWREVAYLLSTERCVIVFQPDNSIPMWFKLCCQAAVIAFVFVLVFVFAFASLFSRLTSTSLIHSQITFLREEHRFQPRKSLTSLWRHICTPRFFMYFSSTQQYLLPRRQRIFSRQLHISCWTKMYLLPAFKWTSTFFLVQILWHN